MNTISISTQEFRHRPEGLVNTIDVVVASAGIIRPAMSLACREKPETDQTKYRSFASHARRWHAKAIACARVQLVSQLVSRACARVQLVGQVPACARVVSQAAGQSGASGC